MLPQAQVNAILPVGFHAHRLTVFVDRTTTSSAVSGAYRHALCVGIDTVLTGYRAAIVEVERDIMKDESLPLGYIRFKLREVRPPCNAGYGAVVELLRNHAPHARTTPRTCAPTACTVLRVVPVRAAVPSAVQRHAGHHQEAAARRADPGLPGLARAIRRARGVHLHAPVRSWPWRTSAACSTNAEGGGGG